MLNAGEDLFICDMAETYHVLNWRELPLTTAAALAFGLPDGARVRRKLSGRDYTLDQLLNAIIADRLGMLYWSLCTKKGTPKPKLFVDALTGKTDEVKSNVKSFDSAEDFKAEFYRITHKGSD